MAISTFPAPSAAGGAAKEKRVDLITSTGSYTVPSGVTYVIAHVVSGGGGGGGQSAAGGIGATSSFSSVSILGGRGGGMKVINSASNSPAGGVNTGNGGSGAGTFSAADATANNGADSGVRMQGLAVTPLSSITVTIGAGGSGPNAGGNGGSGFVSLEYFVEA